MAPLQSPYRSGSGYMSRSFCIDNIHFRNRGRSFCAFLDTMPYPFALPLVGSQTHALHSECQATMRGVWSARRVPVGGSEQSECSIGFGSAVGTISCECSPTQALHSECQTAMRKVGAAWRVPVRGVQQAALGCFLNITAIIGYSALLSVACCRPPLTRP